MNIDQNPHLGKAYIVTVRTESGDEKKMVSVGRTIADAAARAQSGADKDDLEIISMTYYMDALL